MPDVDLNLDTYLRARRRAGSEEGVMSDTRSFTAWLLSRKRRDDRIDDLAGDVRRDRDWPTTISTRDELLSYLRRVGACSEVTAAARAAWGAFRRSQGATL